MSLIRGFPFQTPTAARGHTGHFGCWNDRLTAFSIFLFSRFVVCFDGPAWNLGVFVCRSPALICEARHFRGSVNHSLLPSSEEWLLCF